MKAEVGGLDSFKRQFEAYRRTKEAEVMAYRARVVASLMENLMDNIPVWSGRTIKSMRVGPTEDFAPLTEAGDPSAFGRTRKPFPMGEENMRPAAEAEARSRLPGATQPLDRKVFLTIHSSAWALIEQANAPESGQGRNRAVVSEIAIAKTKAEFGL